MPGTETDADGTVLQDVAVVHDWLPVLAGGERVVAEMIRTCPNSSLYTLFDFLSDTDRETVAQGHRIVTSPLNRLPMAHLYYRYLLLRCTRAIEDFDVTNHEVVLSSSAALAKGVLTSPEQTHIAYVHSPARYAWDLTHDYINGISGLAGGLKRPFARSMMHKFRMWDMRTIPSVDHFIANSQFIRKRIWKVYRRDAQVIYPPVDTSAFTPGTKPREDAYLTVSRLVPYKRVQLIVEAFNQRPDLKLRVVGEGPEMAAIRASAGRNIEILGHLPFLRMRDLMRSAKAFVFAAKEDFGIVPLEAQACGTPVIALGHGGTAETVRPLGQDDPTGTWFHEQSVASLLAALDEFERNIDVFKPETCRAHALTFGAGRFRRELAAAIAKHS